MLQYFFYLSVVYPVVRAAVGEESAGEGFGNMHEFMDQCFELIAGIQLVEFFRVHFDDVSGFDSGDFGEKFCHAPNSGICPGFDIEASDAVDAIFFDMRILKFVHQYIYFPFYIVCDLVVHIVMPQDQFPIVQIQP